MSDTTHHVSADADEGGDGSTDAPFRTVSAAAERARPGDEVVVHDGTYRERVDPPRGGTGDDERITYRAAEGETPVLTGTEVAEGWESVGDGVWEVTLDAAFFDGYNPFDDRIRGDWFNPREREHHTGAVYLDGAELAEAPTREAVRDAPSDRLTWYATAEGGETTVWARFGGADPTGARVEVNARKAVFYPSEPGVDYLTVRGFRMCGAATQWAPPTTEQVGLLGTHWGAGWRIEENHVSHSRCTGITLGKYGENVDDTGASADRYNQTIRDAIDAGWARGNVGHHVVRDNEVHHCEQAGIVGSMGAAFSEVAGNHIYDVNAEGAFGGAEIAGIKFHGAVDATIRGNRIHRARRGIWLDWMTQGTRVTGNLLYDNDDCEDLFLEVNHGPFVVDNNVSLSDTTLVDVSQGGAYVHNLIGGEVVQAPEPDRATPYHPPRSTAVAGITEIQGGDDRFVNNVVCHEDGLAAYDDVERPVQMAGNVYLDGAEPSVHETDPTASEADAPTVVEDGDRLTLRVSVDEAWAETETDLVTTARLGSAAVPDAPFTEPDGTTLRVDADALGAGRDAAAPFPGPFARLDPGTHEVTVWPR
jgi:alpha-N-arabinofuranosidase